MKKTHVSKKKTRKERPRNPVTGRMRKWVCYDYPEFDQLLLQMETDFFLKWQHMTIFNQVRDRLGKERETWSLSEARAMIARLQVSAIRVVRSVMEFPLTETELRYCELEGIDPDDFSQRVEKRS